MTRLNRKLKHILLKVKGWIIGVLLLLHYKLRKSLYIPPIAISKVNKVMFAAHPDDETLFFSKQLINEEGWLVICVTNGATKRANEFINVMKCLNQSYQIWNFPDGLDIKWNKRRLYKSVNKILKLRTWEKVITHNEEGEYGHFQHRQLYECVNSLYNGTELWLSEKTEKLFDESNKLRSRDYEMKLRLINKYYKSQKEVLMKNFKAFVEYEVINCRKGL